MTSVTPSKSNPTGCADCDQLERTVSVWKLGTPEGRCAVHKVKPQALATIEGGAVFNHNFKYAFNYTQPNSVIYLQGTTLDIQGQKNKQWIADLDSKQHLHPATWAGSAVTLKSFITVMQAYRSSDIHVVCGKKFWNALEPEIANANGWIKCKNSSSPYRGTFEYISSWNMGTNMVGITCDDHPQSGIPDDALIVFSKSYACLDINTLRVDLSMIPLNNTTLAHIGRWKIT